ncbi:14-3-3 domain-containing protein [Vairimorpha necatrix]|uniref:14-3-3 domain-containing protein n=1 Tax=Vairimorpha necatrix TaxID=6039 RepID=A0AAX4JFP3_9MICR
MENDEYTDTLFRAYLSDIAERYEDMASEMKLAVKLAHEKNIILTPSARNSFSVAFKNLVSTRRSSWRILCSEKQKQSTKGMQNLEHVEEKVKIVEGELLRYCDEVLDMIDNHILIQDINNNPSYNVEYSIFFLKMKGDYFRYKAEVLKGEESKLVAKLAHDAYSEASEQASPLPTTNPIKLGLALNYSVFYYEILNDPKEACAIARSAFNNAIENLEGLSENHYRDSTLIMQLLRDNLTLWNSREDNPNINDEDREMNPEEEEN